MGLDLGRLNGLDTPLPRVSVIVRSYNRLHALVELLTALLAQDHDSFEIVVVEQSTQRAPEDVTRVDALGRDPRVRILQFGPLGGPGARNAGVRAARGNLFVFIDDDDLPSGRDWLRRHEANFTGPEGATCLGVTGQFLDDGIEKPYINPEKARRNVLSFNVLKWQRVYARTDQRKRVESLMGGNVAIPRRTLERFGLWDECTPIEDEPSLAYRINAAKADDEYLLFDPGVKMIRRLDVPGGMAKRTMSGPRYAKRVFTFLHNITGHYFPVRFLLLYPAYIYFVAYHCIEWICSDSKKHRTLPARIWATTGIVLSILPLWCFWLGEWAWGRLKNGRPTRFTALEPMPIVAPMAVPMPVVAMPSSASASPRALAAPQTDA
ncbi:MAG TPA: glycosyltransferase family 2 protein [Kofleriaceae bacterium]|nr:glycosyltransferase family 2 protein [Kofleriaceae bacterium]